MKIKTLPILAIIMTVCCTLVGNQPSASKWSSENIINPNSQEVTKREDLDGVTFHYLNLCSTTLTFSSDPMYKIPKNELSIVPYGHVISVNKVQPYEILKEEKGVIYLHCIPIIKDGKEYSLHFHTFTDNDRTKFMQMMFFFDSDEKPVDPNEFQLNSHLKNEGKKFVQSLELSETAKKTILETFEY